MGRRQAMAQPAVKTEFSDATLPRKLGLLDATSLTVGVIVGSAIFLVPGEIARSLTTPVQILGVWLVAGILSFFGALAYAELGAMMPDTGGQYIYLREAYGPMTAFLCGWVFFLVVESGGTATIAAGFSIYLGYFIPLGTWSARFVAAGAIAVLTVLNYRGVREGAAAQNLLTALKVGGLVALIAGAFTGGKAEHFTAAGAWSGFSFRAFGVAMVACLWAYEGWNSVSCVAGEVKRPEKTLARSLGLGMALVIGLYMLANIAYIYVMPVAEIAKTERVAAVVAERTMGHTGAMLFALTILVSIAGSLNGSIMTVPRIYFAQARDGLFFRSFGRVHERFETPGFSIAVSSLWSAILALTGSYETLYSYVIFSAWIFYGLAVLAVVVLRRRMPDAPRPYKMHGYPWTPLAFVAVAFWFVGNTLVTDTRSSLIGLAILAAGVPVYFLWKRRGAPEKAEG